MSDNIGVANRVTVVSRPWVISTRLSTYVVLKVVTSDLCLFRRNPLTRWKQLNERPSEWSSPLGSRRYTNLPSNPLGLIPFVSCCVLTVLVLSCFLRDSPALLPLQSYLGRGGRVTVGWGQVSS